jgi:penicillin amidase
MRRGWWRWGGRLLGLVVILAVLAAAGAWLAVRASLPQLDGEVHSPRLSGSVTVARDADGVPLISGANRLDVAYATGYVHGQERFFQMDLLRRSAAGELAELFGPKALPLDRAHRLHRFRALAEQTLLRLAPDERAFVDRYVAGVNDGRNALKARPFEYLLVGAQPRPWTAADALLVVWAMYFDLQGNQEPRELSRAWLQQHADPAQLAFLMPDATGWDAPLDAPAIAADAVAAPIPATAPAWWGRKDAVPARQVAGLGYVDAVGSNNYAVAGTRSGTGAAIVSDDMHLGLQLPNTWYRLALRFPDARGHMRRVVGVSLPGAPPLVIVGSNGHVAWAFTNSYADTLDLVRLERDEAHPGQVRLPSGWETPVEHAETLLVKGAPAERLVVRTTSLGPIREAGGAAYAVHWVAHSPDAVNLRHLALESAGTLDEALDAAAADGIPAQNIVIGDERGNIGWTVAGALPHRTATGRATTFPLQAGGAVPTWDGLLDPAAHPRVVNPPTGQLVTANSRQLAGQDAAVLGDGGFDLGARARQLRDVVAALPAKASVADVFRACLDDRALYVDTWRQRALAALDARALAGHPQRAEFRRLLEQSWDGRASVDSVGYRLAQQYRWSLHDLLFGAANAEMAKLDPKGTMQIASPRWPQAVARLLDERPAGWLPPGYGDWQALALAAVDRSIDEVTRDGTPLAQATWGRRNTATIAHPITVALPALKPWLGAPPDQLPGDANMPRVAGPKFGQSERLTVSPGHEEEGLYDMPGGQSGHPLSPFFLRGHEAWVQGKAMPLLPGAAQYTLTFSR